MTMMADYPSYQRPQRRPVGAPAAAAQAAKPLPQFPPVHTTTQQPGSATHYHSRTASSAIFTPSSPHPSGHPEHAAMPGTMASNRQLSQSQQQPPKQQQQQQHFPPSSRPSEMDPSRRMTNSTVSSNESNPRSSHISQPGYLAAGGAPGQTLPYRNSSTNSSNTNLRRSTSSRSQASSLGPSSYVALLRKQKATVWCERTQHTDPRVTAQTKAAKKRAAHEILMQTGRNSVAMSAAGAASGSGGMLTSRKKNASKAIGGSGGQGPNLAAGTPVPMRLSASEVGDEGSDGEDGVYTGGGGGVHRRTNSGKSSLTGTGGGPQARLSAPRTNTRLSYGSTGTGRPESSVAHTPSPAASDPFAHPGLQHRGSTGSGDSEERREKEMGDVGDMKAPSAAETQESQRQAADLSRRGSVDERSATMRGAAGAMRLFVANPDADDSD